MGQERVLKQQVACNGLFSTRRIHHALVPEGLHASERHTGLTLTGLVDGGLKRGHGLNVCNKEEF